MRAIEMKRFVLPQQALRRQRRTVERHDDPPVLRVIITPPELIAQWQRWCAIRQSLLLTMAITCLLVVFGVVI